MGKTSYLKKWQDGSVWLHPVRGDQSKAHCSICKKDFLIDKCRVSQVVSHSRSTTHKCNEEGTKNQLSFCANGNLQVAQGNHSKLVSIQSINSFLSKNRELAKALEECRLQTKSLEDQKFTYQLECIEMREKLSIYQNAILKCTCCQDNQPHGKTEILFRLEENISQCAKYLNDYVSTLVAQKTNCVEDDLITSGEQVIEKVSAKIFSSKGCQVSFNINASETPSIAPAMKLTRNKKLQVSLMKPCRCQEQQYSIENQNSTVKVSELSTQSSAEKIKDPSSVEKKSKKIQCSMSSIQVRSFATQCDVIDKQPYSPIPSKKNNCRRPLSILNNVNNGSQLSCTGKQRKNIKKPSTKSEGITGGEIRSCLSKPKPFEIYEDENNKENMIHSNNKIKQRRKVTIASPVEICYFEAIAAGTPVDERLRQRVYKNYKEPSLNTKLRRSDSIVDEKFYTSPHPKVKRPKKSRQYKKKKPTIAIEDIISLVEESFIAGAASVVNS